jgi:cation transport regulator
MKAALVLRAHCKESKLPYNKITELPKQVKDNVPKHGQEIYKEAFNSAIEQYDGDEERAHRVAWSAVKEKYKKEDGEWKPKKSE